MNKNTLKGILAVLLASLLFGFTPMLTNSSLFGTLPWLQRGTEVVFTNESVVVFSMGFAGIFSMISALFQKKSLKIRPAELRDVSIFGGGLFCATCLLLSYSYRLIPVGTAVVLHFFYPVATCLISALFFREKLSPAKAVAALIAVAGIFFVSDFEGVGNLLGPLLAVGSGVAYACYCIGIERSRSADIDPAVRGMYINFSSAAIAFVAALVTGRLMLPPNWVCFLSTVCEAVIGYLLAIRLIIYGIGKLGATSASVVNTFEPVMAALLASLFYNEVMDLKKIVGCAMVLSATFIIVLAARAKQKKAALQGDIAAQNDTAVQGDTADQSVS